MDVCDVCETEHHFDPDLGDVAYVFLDSMCHYICTTCPHCGLEATLYVDGDYLIEAVTEYHLTTRLVAVTPPMVRELCRNAESVRLVQEELARELEDVFQRELPQLGSGS